MYFGFKDISIAYNDKEVIKSVSISFERGRCSVIIGQNGSGKSSLLKTISRAVRAKDGEVIFMDKPIESYKPKTLARHIAYLSQQSEIPADIDVRTLVSHGRFPHISFGKGLTYADAEIIDNALAITGLCDLQFKKVGFLSGGEKQRARIAMTICQSPEILILDEPTTYLDIGYQIETLELVKKLKLEFGITIIMVLHDINLAARYADMLYVIKDGSVYLSGSPKEVVTRKTLLDVFNVSAKVFTDDENNCPYFIVSQKEK